MSLSLCRHPTSVGRPSSRASSAVVCRAQTQQQSRRQLLAAGGLALLGYSLPAAASQEQPAASPSGSTYSSSSSNSDATAISISFVSPAVTQKLRERDENLAWKCTGTMFDCSGEEAAAAQKAAEERAKSIRKFFDAINGEGGR